MYFLVALNQDTLLEFEFTALCHYRNNTQPTSSLLPFYRSRSPRVNCRTELERQTRIVVFSYAGAAFD